jgi:uncharacterized protein YdeI (YjbR/CyaY-like superfamily)
MPKAQRPKAKAQSPKPTFFATPADFRRWLQKHHRTAGEVLVGFYKKSSGRPSITWPESVDEALCFGWIDGIRRNVDDESYTIRFTPRRKGSIWSAVNTRRAQELLEEGRMQAAGREAFEARDAKKSAVYSYERETAQFDAESEQRFKANARAWEFFSAQPPGYRRLVTHFVTSAKREETRARRLETLINLSAAGRRLEMMRPTADAPAGKETAAKRATRRR